MGKLIYKNILEDTANKIQIWLQKRVRDQVELTNQTNKAKSPTVTFIYIRAGTTTPLSPWPQNFLNSCKWRDRKFDLIRGELKGIDSFNKG